MKSNTTTLPKIIEGEQLQLMEEIQEWKIFAID
jgi:hypothetical protein